MTEQQSIWSVNPATGERLANFAFHSQAEQDVLLDQAWHGFRAWRAVPAASRAGALSKLAAVLRHRAEQLASGITAEMGKPIIAAKAEVAKCAALCDWYAENLASLLADEPVDVGADGEAVIAYLPIGPILAVMPWNFPLWQVLRAAVPIIASGNSFLLKHADNVQGSAQALIDAFDAAGFLEGVFGSINVQAAALPRLIADNRIAAVTVTAGVQAGANVAAEAGRNLKKSVLELGGSDPFIVLADADFDRAVAAAVEARYQNSGQVCIAAKRIIVERSILQPFTVAFVEAARKLTQGDPLDPSTNIGPLARHRLRDELHAQVEKSVRLGAKLLLGGKIPEGPGAFYPATVLAEVTREMPVFHEETFGPVAALIAADDQDDAIRIANDSGYGLSAALWTSPSRAAQLARTVESGSIFVNGISMSDPRVPIGGIKQSGYGRELSHFGLREFCNAQLLWKR